MKKRSREEAGPGVGVRVAIALIALGVIAYGVWTAVTGVWHSEGQVQAEGPLARAVGVALVVCGAVALVRVVFRPGGQS
jgi:TRAP-type C4-dicarboxylate transport system permease small subunit